MSEGTDYSKLLFHNTYFNYRVECEDNKTSLGINYIKELENQAKQLIQIIQRVELQEVYQITHICQSAITGMEYLGMVQYTYYGVPTSLDVLREKGILYMQFHWKPFEGIYITETGFLNIGRPYTRSSKAASADTITDQTRDWKKLRAFDALEFTSYENEGFHHVTGVHVNKEERDLAATIMGNFYIPELENELLEVFERNYNETVLRCLTYRSDELIHRIREDFQTLITDLEDNRIPEDMIRLVMNFVSTEIQNKSYERNTSKDIDDDEEEEE